MSENQQALCSSFSLKTAPDVSFFPNARVAPSAVQSAKDEVYEKHTVGLPVSALNLDPRQKTLRHERTFATHGANSSRRLLRQRGTHVLMKASAEKKNCIPLAPAGDIKTWKEVREKNIDD